MTKHPIIVAVPVLDRPHAAAPLAEALRQSDTHRLCRLVFVCSPNDGASQDACRKTRAGVLVLRDEPGPGDFARKIQLAFDCSEEPFLFQAADDVTFRSGWAEAALARIECDGGYGVCGTWDGANPLVMRGQHSTHSLIRRDYVNECGASWDGPGSVFSTAYHHQYVDNELVALAKLRGCFTFARGAEVIHRHPIYDRTVARDTTYERGLGAARDDLATFKARQAEWTAVLV